MSGCVFAAAFFAIFTISERQNLRKHAITARQMKDHFQLEHQDTISRESTAIRPGAIMVTMRDAGNPLALKWTLSRTNTDEKDIVVISVRMMGVGGPEYLSAEDQTFSEHEQMIFTKAVSVAESFGKKVSLLVVPAGDVFAALVQGANSLEVDSVVSGISSKLTAEEQAYYMGQAWEALPEPKRQFNFYVIDSSGGVKVFYIGPHAPNLSPDDVQLVHRLVAEYAARPFGVGPASQRHHHLCPYATGWPICTREAGDTSRSAQLSRGRIFADMSLGGQGLSTIRSNDRARTALPASSSKTSSSVRLNGLYSPDTCVEVTRHSYALRNRLLSAFFICKESTVAYCVPRTSDWPERVFSLRQIVTRATYEERTGGTVGVSNILAEIDREIAQLQQARALLSGSAAPKAKTTAAAPAAKKRGRKKKRNLTPESRKRIVEAVKRRWALQKKAGK